jgi:hypothetical protein
MRSVLLAIDRADKITVLRHQGARRDEKDKGQEGADLDFHDLPRDAPRGVSTMGRHFPNTLSGKV